MKISTITEIIALLFVILFLYTGISKLMDYSVFREQIALSPLLAPVSNWVAILLPATEIIISVVLFIPRSRLIGLYASLILMVLFTGYVIYILNFNEHLPCTCGGVLEALSWKQHLILNGLLIALAFTGVLLGRRSQHGYIRHRSRNAFHEPAS